MISYKLLKELCEFWSKFELSFELSYCGFYAVLYIGLTGQRAGTFDWFFFFLFDVIIVASTSLWSIRTFLALAYS